MVTTHEIPMFKKRSWIYHGSIGKASAKNRIPFFNNWLPGGHPTISKTMFLRDDWMVRLSMGPF
jgi:hypothetical protein